MSPISNPRSKRAIPLLASALLISSCSMQPTLSEWPPQAPPEEPLVVDGEALDRIEQIRERSAVHDEVVIQVFPLAESMVADLVAEARAAEQRGELELAEGFINEALSLHPDDPELWQLRAEFRVGLAQWQLADADARHAWRIGPRTGPLCARHWVTVAMAQRELAQDALAADADAELERCLLRPPERW